DTSQTPDPAPPRDSAFAAPNRCPRRRLPAHGRDSRARPRRRRRNSGEWAPGAGWSDPAETQGPPGGEAEPAAAQDAAPLRQRPEAGVPGAGEEGGEQGDHDPGEGTGEEGREAGQGPRQ